MKDSTAALAARHIWPPYTPIERWEAEPVPVVESAEHIYLTTQDGRRLIDAVGSWWVSNLGHGYPRVREALHAQLDRMPHVAAAGLTHPPAAALASRLAAAAPGGLERVFYSDNGSTAVEVAVRAAFQFWQQQGHPEKRVFVSLDGAYHGDTIGAVSVGGIATFHDRFAPLLFERLAAPTPSRVGEDASLRALDALLQEHGARVAALVIEPLVQGAAGMCMHSPAYLKAVAERCRAHDVLLIADEVFVGFGRTGTLFACEQAGVEPDFLCLSKGLTAGMLPFAATLATARVYDGFRGEGHTFYYGHSYCGNPLGCVAALAVLDAFEQDGVLDNVAERGAQLGAWLERQAGREGVHETRRTGLIGAIQLGTSSAYTADIGWAVYRAALERGAYLRPLGNVIYMVPALTIREDELEALLAIVDESLSVALA